MSVCTCPPVADVLRGRAGDTRPECPLHPTPDFAPDTFLPRIDTTGMRFVAPVPAETRELLNAAVKAAISHDPRHPSTAYDPDGLVRLGDVIDALHVHDRSDAPHEHPASVVLRLVAPHALSSAPEPSATPHRKVPPPETGNAVTGSSEAR